MQLNAELKRVLLEGVDVEAPDEVREWVRQAVQAEVVTTGGLAPRFYFFGDDFLEVVDLSQVHAAEGVLASVFLQLGTRSEVRRRLRVGTAHLDDAGGRSVHAVCLLDVQGENWHLQWRARDRGGFSGVWRRAQGRGPEALPGALRGWVEPGDVVVDAVLGQTRAPATPEVRASFLDYQGRIPDTAREIASLAAWICASDLVALGGVAILVFGDMVEQWEVSGDLPCTVDDLVRHLTAQGTPSAVAVVRVGAADVGGEPRRVLRTRAEGPDGAAATLIPLQGQERMASIPEPPGPLRWLGFPPEVELEMPVIAVDGWSGPIAES